MPKSSRVWWPQVPTSPGIRLSCIHNSPRAWLSWWFSCPAHLAALRVQQSWVSNSPWTSLLGARDPQEPSSACSGRAMGVPEQGQMGL